MLHSLLGKPVPPPPAGSVRPPPRHSWLQLSAQMRSGAEPGAEGRPSPPIADSRRESLGQRLSRGREEGEQRRGGGRGEE